MSFFSVHEIGISLVMSLKRVGLFLMNSTSNFEFAGLYSSLASD